MLPDFAINQRVRLTGRALAHFRQLTQHGGDGIPFADGYLTREEAAGVFTWIGLGQEQGRDARVRSDVSGREGWLFRGFFKAATGTKSAR